LPCRIALFAPLTQASDYVNRGTDFDTDFIWSGSFGPTEPEVRVVRKRKNCPYPEAHKHRHSPKCRTKRVPFSSLHGEQFEYPGPNREESNL